MNKWNAIFETLNEAIEWKNTEISALKYQLENAQKENAELKEGYLNIEKRYEEMTEMAVEKMQEMEKQHKEEVELLEARIIYLEGKLNPCTPHGPAGEKEKENGNR